MEENRKGFILSAAEVIDPGPGDTIMVQCGGKENSIQLVKMVGRPNLEQVYPLLRPSSVAEKVGPESSMHTFVTLNKLQPGGGAQESYFQYNADMPVFDYVVYVISGRMRVKVGDIEKIVGADTLIYCPSNVKTSFTNVGKGPAKILGIHGSGEGEKTGGHVFTKNPSWNCRNSS